MNKKDHAGLPMGEGSSKFKPHVNMTQCLGRLFRSGIQRLVIAATPVDNTVADKVRGKLIMFDESVLLKNGKTIMFPSATTATGHSLHLHPYQRKVAKRMWKRIKNTC